ncbi:hypothetical protein ACIA47_22605 [Micromonospora sp. NPDC051227]|uniref:hypothetical protein n=1 Tax=Micromonospora sp. NPDC051227 TaxID=3364285 RepID=UPI0037A164E6
MRRGVGHSEARTRSPGFSGSLGKGTQYPPKLGAALPVAIPVAIIFVVFQRYFVRDANDGSDKG